MLDAVLNFLWASDMGGQTYVDQPVSNQAAASFIDLIYETQDGYMTVSTMTNKEWEALSRAFKRPDLLEDPRFKTPQLRGHNVNDRLDVVQEVLLCKTTQEWLDIFDQEDVPSAPALTRDEVIKHPQVIASDILREHDHPIAGRLRQARVAARFEGTPPSEPRGAPQLGEHSDEVLIELGFSDKEISALKASGAVGNESYST